MRGPVDALREDRTGRKPDTPRAADASHGTQDSRRSPTRVLTSSTANDDVGYCSWTFASWERPRCHSFISKPAPRDLRLLIAVYIVRFTTDTLKRPQFFPPRIDRSLVGVIGLAVQVRTALDTQT
jgi:hypothetical protein